MIWAKIVSRILLGSLFILVQLSASAQNYSAKNVKVRLFSSTPIEDIRAVNVKAIAVLVSKTREIVVEVPIRSFEFDKKLMQEHFNENYMESDQYPTAKFKGIIDQQIDFTKDGTYNVSVTGKLTVHGVDQQRNISGKLLVNKGVLLISTAFKVACVDHKIKIPNLVITKVAEVININVDGQLNLLK